MSSTLSVEQCEGYVLAKTTGPIDDAARDSFRASLHPLVAERGTRLIVDLAGSPRVDSAGLGHLVTLVTHANTNSSRVVYCNVPSFISLVFSVTKLDRLFDVAKTLDEAIERL